MSTTQASARSDWRQLWSGIAAGIVVVATVLSGLLLASQEPGGVVPTTIALVSGTPVVLEVPSLTPTLVPVTVIAATPVAVTVTPGPSVTATPTVVCPPQAGWWLYTARQGDTLGSIAMAFGADAYLLIQGNCLLNTNITAGQTLYIPPIPTRTPVSTRGPAPAPTLCGPPLTWVIYFVQPGDTLYGLALRYRISVSALARANCLTSYTLRVGQPLYVPPGSVIPPTATRVPPSATRPPVASSTPPVPSVTVLPSVTPSRTSTRVLPSPSPSATGPSATPPSVTPGASDTPSPTTPPADSTPSATPPTPTQTSVPPTLTAQPPTATLPPPTNTLPPPTNTLPPPTLTPHPPTATALPPTDTAPPSATP